MINDICDPTFGAGYICKNPECEFYDIPRIVHTCSKHPLTEEKLKCSGCKKKMSPYEPKCK